MPGWSGAGDMAGSNTSQDLPSTRFALRFYPAQLCSLALMADFSADPEQKTQSYQWPIWVGGFVVLWIGLTVAWMIWGVKQTKAEREMREGLDAYGNEKNSTKTKAIHQ